MAEYEIIEYEGKEARKYPDGVIRSPRGYIVFIPPEIARQHREQRTAKAKMSAEQALAQGTKSETPEEGWGKILMARIDVALNDKGRAGNDAARLVGIAAGYLTQERKLEVEGNVDHKVTPQLPPEYHKYLKRLAERPQAIEGRVIDDERDDADE